MRTFLSIVIGIVALALAALIFVAPIVLFASAPHTPSTCIQGRTCDPTHDTLQLDGSIVHYGR